MKFHIPFTVSGIERLNKKPSISKSLLKHKKDSHFVEVLVQLWCLYLYDILQTKNRYVNILLNIPIISASLQSHASIPDTAKVFQSQPLKVWDLTLSHTHF